MEVKIFKTLLINLIKTFFISCFITWLGVELIYPSVNNSSENGNGFFFAIGIIMILFLVCSSISVFLNLSEKIRTNKSYSALSFFFLPITSLFFFMWYFQMMPKNSRDYSELSIIIIPFIIIHSYYYFRFLKLLKEDDKK